MQHNLQAYVTVYNQLHCQMLFIFSNIVSLVTMMSIMHASLPLEDAGISSVYSCVKKVL